MYVPRGGTPDRYLRMAKDPARCAFTCDKVTNRTTAVDDVEMRLGNAVWASSVGVGSGGGAEFKESLNGG